MPIQYDGQLAKQELTSVSRPYNFSPGPAMLPEAVLQTMQGELLNWNNSGLSVMELPHRSPEFKGVAAQLESNFRDVLQVPENFSILFLHGGARMQFSMIPSSLLSPGQTAAYVQTGLWSKKSVEEASIYCDPHVIYNNADSRCCTLAPFEQWEKVSSDCAYVHYVDNETVNGLEFQEVLPDYGVPLICDMSSNILSRPVDFSRFAMVYAGAQKNLGMAGVTVVIIRDDLLEYAGLSPRPSLFNYKSQLKTDSMLNTPATFPWYVTDLVCQWVRSEGGVEEMNQRAIRRSTRLYDFLDHSDFYNNPVDPAHRSRMNVVFTLADESHNERFVTEGAERGLCYLGGHRTVGGMRASMYNSMPESGVEALIDYMIDFEKRL